MTRFKSTARRANQSSKKPKKTNSALKSAPMLGGLVQRPPRMRPGELALKQIRQYQRSTDNLIRKAPFQRLVVAILKSLNTDFRIRQLALTALQSACEDFITGFFEDINVCALHANRVTVMVKDLYLVKRIRGIYY